MTVWSSAYADIAPPYPVQKECPSTVARESVRIEVMTANSFVIPSANPKWFRLIIAYFDHRAGTVKQLDHKRTTVLYVNDLENGNIVSNFRLITCLLPMWKVLPGILAGKLNVYSGKKKGRGAATY